MTPLRCHWLPVVHEMLRGRNESLGSRHHKDSESVFSEPSRCRGVKLIYPYNLQHMPSRWRSLSSMNHVLCPVERFLSVFPGCCSPAMAAIVLVIPKQVAIERMAARVAGLGAAMGLADACRAVVPFWSRCTRFTLTLPCVCADNSADVTEILAATLWRAGLR